MSTRTSPAKGRNPPSRASPKRATLPADRVLLYQLNPRLLILTRNESTNTIGVQICNAPLTPPQLFAFSRNAIISCFRATTAHPIRLTYCTAGLMFHASSPLPYGGPKQTPGYSEFLNSDNSNNQLLDFLVTAAFKAYWKFRGPVALNFLADSVNRVLGLQVAGAKDALDELLLKGMKKSGQIEWFGPAQIPEYLRHQYQGRREEGVWFTPVLMRMDPSCRARVRELPPSSLIIRRDDDLNTISLQICTTSLTPPQIIASSKIAIICCFRATRCHPYRLTYCTAGLMFHASSPLPFGGPKQSPGYAEFLNTNNSNNELLDFLVSSAFTYYWKCRGPISLNFLVDSINRILTLQAAGDKFALDELLLKGMKKTGQIEWFGPARIPDHLRHHNDVKIEEGVPFTPVSLLMDFANQVTAPSAN